jgi:hypothetical protein
MLLSVMMEYFSVAASSHELVAVDTGEACGVTGDDALHCGVFK